MRGLLISLRTLITTGALYGDSFHAVFELPGGLHHVAFNAQLVDEAQAGKSQQSSKPRRGLLVEKIRAAFAA